ncbi:MAG: hypothetical protein C0497_00240 [Gemmatimonas sp.]|nr:hypothetical protein [Gemmatimonas sp.]
MKTTRSFLTSETGTPSGPGTMMPRMRSRRRIGTYISSHAVMRRSAGGPSAMSMPRRLKGVPSVSRSASLRNECALSESAQARLRAPPSTRSSASRTRVEQLSRK